MTKVYKVSIYSFSLQRSVFIHGRINVGMEHTFLWVPLSLPVLSLPTLFSV